MKKLVAFMLCCMMLAGSLCAFAEEGVMPIYECPCTSTYTELIRTRKVGTCTTIKTYEVICRTCSKSHGTYDVESTSHTWVDEIIDGELVKACRDCGEVK